TLPEALSLAESEDATAALEKNGMRAAEIIVNRVLPPGDRCPVCNRRRADESRVLAQIQTRLGPARAVRIVPADGREPRGLAALRKIGKKLATTEDAADIEKRLPRVPRVLRGGAFPVALSAPKGELTVSPESLNAIRGTTLLFVGGKGGVGKTTV